MQFYLISFILESAVVRSEMEVVLRCENYVQVDALTVADFTMLKWSRARCFYLSSISISICSLQIRAWVPYAQTFGCQAKPLSLLPLRIA